MLDNNGARPQTLRRLPEEAGQNAIFKSLDIDLQRVDVAHSCIAENALQRQ